MNLLMQRILYFLQTLYAENQEVIQGNTRRNTRRTFNGNWLVYTASAISFFLGVSLMSAIWWIVARTRAVLVNQPGHGRHYAATV